MGSNTPSAAYNMVPTKFSPRWKIHYFSTPLKILLKQTHCENFGQKRQTIYEFLKPIQAATHG